MTRELGRRGIALWTDCNGMILPYVTIMLVVIIGLSVLAIDGARYMNLQSELQSGADALALAGAAELDRLPDAQLRSVAAINNLVTNRVASGGAGGAVGVSKVQFLSRLPATDISPITDDMSTLDATDTRFVSVTVRPVALATILPASLFGGSNTMTAGATAVAGFDEVVCDMTPIFVCNPFETAGMSYGQAATALQLAAANPAARRRLMVLRENESRLYAPGDFGYLENPVLGGDPNATIDAVARTHSQACYRHSTLTIKRGIPLTVADAFNTRFDIYAGAMAGNRNDPDYRPAANVRKGFVGAGSAINQCNARPATNWPIGSPPNQATGLPLDRDWPAMDGRMGNGVWDFDTYWQVNHDAAGRTPPLINGEPASNSNLPSRYNIYRYEIEQGLVGDRSPGAETGDPTCYGGPLANEPDRRVIQTAIVNCVGAALDEQSSAVRVVAFGKFFMTLPMPRGSTDIYAELVGLVTPGDSSTNFEMVQLYR
jgi:Flp pilus assembly protein TadG